MRSHQLARTADAIGISNLWLGARPRSQVASATYEAVTVGREEYAKDCCPMKGLEPKGGSKSAPVAQPPSMHIDGPRRPAPRTQATESVVSGLGEGPTARSPTSSCGYSLSPINALRMAASTSCKPRGVGTPIDFCSSSGDAAAKAASAA